MGAAWACLSVKQSNDLDSSRRPKCSQQSDESNKVQMFKNKFDNENCSGPNKK